MTRRTIEKQQARKQYSQALKDEAPSLANKVSVAQSVPDLGLHDSQLYDRRQKSRRQRRHSAIGYVSPDHFESKPTPMNVSTFLG